MAFSTWASQDDDYESELTGGMESLVSLAECLPHAETDPDKHGKMQGHGKCALEKMKAAKKALEARRSALNSRIGDLLVKRKELEDEEDQKRRKLSLFEIELEHHEQMQTWIQEKLAVAENHLQELTATLKKARKEEKCSKIMTRSTLVLLPLYTLLVSMEFFQEALKVTDSKELFLAAGTVTILCHVSMYIAQKAARELQKTISQYKVQVSDYQREACICAKDKREIKEKIAEIQAGQGKMKEIGGELMDLSAALQEEEEELKKHIKFVSQLSGKVNALMDDPLDYEYTCMILEEVSQLMLSVVGKRAQESLRFPDRETIKNLVEKLKNSVPTLREDPDKAKDCTMAAAEGQFQAITKAMATLSITEADKVRKEAELLLKPDAKWEELLMPAPISIAILGELACTSMKQKDCVSVNKNSPKGGFKSIKRPESFRACLRQVSDQAWEAFNEVHVNMDQIRLHSTYVSKRMTHITQGFFRNTQEGKNQLQTEITKIQNKAEKCTASAQAAKDKFLEVIFLVKELLEACRNAEHSYEKDLNGVRMELEQAKIKEKSVRKTLEDAEWKQMQVEVEMKEALNEIGEALNFSPMSCYDLGSGVTDKMEWIKKQISKVEESGEALRRSHKEDHRSVMNIIKRMKELTEILCEMKEYEMREEDLETARKMLIERQDALGKVAQQWDKMVQFFHMIANLIQFCFNWNVQQCLASVECIQQITHAFNASSLAQLVHMLSKIFTRVCEEYLLTLVSSSGRILTLEPSNPSFDPECAKIASGCDEAQKAISSLVLEMKEEFKRNLHAGLETIKKMEAMQHP